MITLVFCGDLRYCPYIKRYTERLDAYKCEYEVLFWNRAGLELELPKNYYYYDSPSDESLGKFKKLFDFWGFKRWVEHHILSQKCDGLILLSTLTAILLSNKLKKYKGKYIFDIRDYSYENIGFFKKIECKVINNSYFTAISSKGFKTFLPKHDYVIAHNFNRNEMIDTPAFIRQECPLKLVWNGTVRFFDFQKRYLDALKNDERFLMIYHGTGTDLLQYKEYCRGNKIFNVEFTGAYDNKNKKNLLKDAAILNNCYGGKDGDQLKYAVSNRYYDGLIYHIPQLVEPEGFKTSITEKGKVGIALNADDSFADNLYSYYMKIDAEKFDMACKSELEKIIAEDDIYIKKIDDFIKKIGQE